ncbi:MAG: hypothetical protein Q9M43_02730 [Sulfurimonas sp.]|nr:hypothetical protein [Sulfurimonas sp.]
MRKIKIDYLSEELAYIITDEPNEIKIKPVEIMIVLDNRPFLRMSSFEYHGYDAVKETVKLVLMDLSNEKIVLKGISNFLMHFKVNEKYETSKIIDVFYTYRSLIMEKVNIYLGISYDSNLPLDYVKTTVLI